MRTMAKLSLLLCLTVLGIVFLTSGAHGTDSWAFQVGWDTADRARAIATSARGYGAPHTIGSALTLAFLVFGFSVLAMGAVAPSRPSDAHEGDPFFVVVHSV